MRTLLLVIDALACGVIGYVAMSHWLSWKKKRAAVEWLVIVLRQVVPLAASAQRAEDKKWDPPAGSWVDGFGQERKLADLSNDHLLNVRNFLLRAIREDELGREAWLGYDDGMTAAQLRVYVLTAEARDHRIERRQQKLAEVEAEVEDRHLKRKRSYYR